MPLGSKSQAAGGAPCSKILQLAATKGAVALVSATRPQSIPLGYPPASGERTALVTLPQTGVYTAWMGGDWYGLATVSVSSIDRLLANGTKLVGQAMPLPMDAVGLRDMILSQADTEATAMMTRAIQTFAQRNDFKGSRTAVAVPGQQTLTRFTWSLTPVAR